MHKLLRHGSGPTRHRVFLPKRLALVLKGQFCQVKAKIFSTWGFQNKFISRHPWQFNAKMISFRGVEAVHHKGLLWWCLFKWCGIHLPNSLIFPIACKRLLIVSCGTGNDSADCVEFELGHHPITPAIARLRIFVVYQSVHYLSH